jgi:hypothetical protein
MKHVCSQMVFSVTILIQFSVISWFIGALKGVIQNICIFLLYVTILCLLYGLCTVNKYIQNSQGSQVVLL